VLVDEAHNLVERAREMYSARLDRAALRAVERAAPAAAGTALRRLGRAWSATLKGQDAPYRAHAQLPAALAAAARDAVAALAEHVEGPQQSIEQDGKAALLDGWFALLAFVRLADSFGEHSVFETRRAAPAARDARDSSIAIRNVVPAPFLRPRFAAARTVVLFSATLAPPHYDADLLGLPADAAWLDIAGPFAPEQLEVRVVAGLSTRYARRAASLAPIAEQMAQQYARRPGNYLAFFSSFDYLAQAAAAFRARCPEVPIWLQTRGMAALEKDAFLARFDAAGRGIGFAVLGGSFAESIDLPGERLIGAFIATLGLPQVNAENDETARRLQAMFDAGFEYAYLYPGLRKVVQAAGRVIRTPSDTGCVVLMDERYATARVQRLLPAWWRVQRAAPLPDQACAAVLKREITPIS